MADTFLLEHWDNYSNVYLLLKFEPSLKRSTITNQRFEVSDMSGATPGLITDPFKPIDVSRDYNSISKTLKLYWRTGVLDPSTTYEVTIRGLQNAIGIQLPVDSFTLTTDDSFSGDSGTGGGGDGGGGTPTPTPTTDPIIEDYSIRDDIVIDTTASTTTDPGYSTRAFRVVSVFPDNGSVYLSEDENNGVVEIQFSQRVNPAQLNSSMFKTQRKKMQRSPARWETLQPTIAQDPQLPIVYVTLPSTEGIYFEEDYRYRVIVSKALQPEA